MVWAAPNTALPAPKFTCPGHMGLWEAAPKAGSPWGQAESFVLQVPLNIPVRNHLQPCNARQGTDLHQRPLKLWFPHPMGLCWHNSTSSWQPRAVQSSSVHGIQQSTCRNVSSASPQPHQACERQGRVADPAPGAQSCPWPHKVKQAAQAGGRKFTSKTSYSYSDPRAPLGSWFGGREPKHLWCQLSLPPVASPACSQGMQSQLWQICEPWQGTPGHLDSL